MRPFSWIIGVFGTIQGKNRCKRFFYIIHPRRRITVSYNQQPAIE